MTPAMALARCAGCCSAGVENGLSKRLLKGDVRTGDHIVVGYDPDGEGENKLTFDIIEQAPIPVELPLAQES